MEEQMRMAQTGADAAIADERSDIEDDILADEQIPVGGAFLPADTSNAELTPEAQKSRHAKAEAAYGAIADIIKSTDGPDTKVDRRV